MHHNNHLRKTGESVIMYYNNFAVSLVCVCLLGLVCKVSVGKVGLLWREMAIYVAANGVTHTHMLFLCFTHTQTSNAHCPAGIGNLH